MSPILKKKLLPSLLFSLVSFTTLFAQGDLLVYPKRIVFDGSKRSQDLSLVNNGNDSARYVISIVQIRMKADGSFETIDQPDPGQNFADRNFRLFPRSVVLGPKESQVVKVQVTKYTDLLPGEYRSHLYLRAETEKPPLGMEKTQNDSGGISVRIVPVFGISIPVIIRTGKSTTEIGLSHVKFQFDQDSIPVLNMQVNRSGNMSVYGDVTVTHISPEGKETRVNEVKGVAVYTPNTSRTIRLALNTKAGVDFRKGSLHVVYADRSGKTEILAQEQIFCEGQKHVVAAN